MDVIDYVTYDPTGNLTGGFEQELQPEHADCFIRVTYDIRNEWTSYRANAARDGVEPVALSEPATSMVPESVPMLNAHLALISAGKMDMLLSIVAALPDQDRQEAQAYLNLALNCRRDNKWVLQIGPALGYDAAGLDQLFIAADALNP